MQEKMVNSYQVKSPETKLSNNSYLTGKPSPYNNSYTQQKPKIQENKPLLQSYQEPKSPNQYSDYYQFTRPSNKNKNEGVINNSNSISSLKSGKSKKISIVSNRKTEYAQKKN